MGKFEILMSSKTLSREVITDAEKIISELNDTPIFKYIDSETVRSNIDNLRVTPVADNALDGLAYSPNTNELLVNLNRENGRDFQFLLTKEILALAANRSGKCGFNTYAELEPIDQGLRENLAECLVGNIAPTPFTDEKIIVNQMMMIYGEDALLKSYFKGEPNLLLNKMGIDNNDPLIQEIYSNYHNRNIEGSLLGSIQMRLIDAFFEQERTNDEVEMFQANIYSNSETLNNRNVNYDSVNDVADYFNQQIKSGSKSLN